MNFDGSETTDLIVRLLQDAPGVLRTRKKTIIVTGRI